MGYTHYWTRPSEIKGKTMSAIVADFRRILPRVRHMIAGSLGDGEPLVSEELVSFNGKGDKSHETFHFPRIEAPERFVANLIEGGQLVKGSSWTFCKTARKDYDIVACSFLIIAKHHLGKKLNVTSDGRIEDDYPNAWKPAMQLCQETLGYGADFQLDENEEFNTVF